MKKLTLDLDGIVVDTFRTDGPAGRTGTVAAHGWTEGLTFCSTCGGSCPCIPDTGPGPTWEYCTDDYSCDQWSGCQCAPTEGQTNCPDLSCRWTCGGDGSVTCGYPEC